MSTVSRVDPSRALQLAIRSTRLLGVLFILVGVLTPVPTLRRGATLMSLPWPVVVASLTHLVPGVLYWVSAELLRRRRRSAVFAALGMALFHFIIVAGNLAAYVTLLAGEEVDRRFLFTALVVGFLAVAALAQLMYHLIKSLSAVSVPAEPDEFEDPLCADIEPV
jgi:hypothetical protein